MKKLFRKLLVILMHLLILAGIMYLGLYLGAILDDIVPRWSIDPEYMALAAGIADEIYWLKQGLKKLESK